MVPWKLVFVLIMLGLAVFFAGFNLDNTSDISFGFYQLQDIPIFISLFTAFIIGAFFMLPFAIRRRKRVEKNKREKTLSLPLSKKKRGKKKEEKQEKQLSESDYNTSEKDETKESKKG